MKITVYIPVKGQTYSLFGNNSSTDQYFLFIDSLVNSFFKQFTEEEISASIKNCKPVDNYIKLFFEEYLKKNNSAIHSQFEVYTEEVKHHLNQLSFSQRFDKTLRTKQSDYHIYMMEYEIVNRINKEKFKPANYKIALLPHCLRDTNKNCKAQMDEVDMVCRHCSKDCFINFASRVLKENNVHPYIWMNLDEKKLFKNLYREYGSLGVLGIACLPELINGMRNCIKKGIPVIGIPLNANRCMRWMGEYHENSFSVERLQLLFK